MRAEGILGKRELVREKRGRLRAKIPGGFQRFSDFIMGIVVPYCLHILNVAPFHDAGNDEPLMFFSIQLLRISIPEKSRRKFVDDIH